jgi:hypothetical protein
VLNVACAAQKSNHQSVNNPSAKPAWEGPTSSDA